MKERASTKMSSATVHSTYNDIPRLPLGPSMRDNSHSPKGFQVNLLANSLAMRLKHQGGFTGKELKESMFPKKYKFQKHRSHSGSARSGKTHAHRQESAGNTKPPIHGSSSKSSSQAGSANEPKPDQSSRVSSAIEQPPDLSARSKTSKIGSGRSNSAGRLQSMNIRASSRRTLRKIGYDDEILQDSSGLSFRHTGVDATVKVVKRDGIFQSVDKYAPTRQDFRDIGHLYRKPACDFDMYVLPLCGDENAFFDQDASPLGYSDLDKKRCVSWDVMAEHMDNVANNEEEADLHLSGNPTPSAPNNAKRTAPTDYFAYRRPLYSTGRSKVTSIGLKWAMPTVEQDESTKVHRVLKPMWSWLVTNETKQDSQHPKPKHKQPISTQSNHSSQSSKSGSTATNLRARHSRNVHPVSTAMDREGTSVSKTKWKVPSSNSSTLDPDRTVMERLELVKRPGSRVFYYQGRNLENERYKEGRQMNRDNGEIVGQTTKSETRQSINSDEDSQTITNSSPRRDYQSSSPTKSRSTYCN